MVTSDTGSTSRQAAITMMTTMFLEERQSARHQETQRSTVSTIIVSLAAALLAVTGVLWNKVGYLDLFALPITGSIALLGIFGYLVSTKLFERSMVHYSLSEAYRETIQALGAPDVHAHLPVGSASLLQLPYVRNAIGKTGFYPTGAKLNKKGARFRIQLATHDVVDPRPIVVPIHNDVARFLGRPLATIRLHTLWNGLFIGIIMLGFGLSIASAFWPRKYRDQPAAQQCCATPTAEKSEVLHPSGGILRADAGSFGN
jgi:hypothetical protein